MGDKRKVEKVVHTLHSGGKTYIINLFYKKFFKIHNISVQSGNNYV